MNLVRPALSLPAPRRLAAVGVLSLGLVGASTVAADAHVTVRADSTESGSFSQLTFRVPNESDTAGTVKVAVQLPQDTPFAFVSVKPVPGWKADVQEATLPKPVTAEGGATITKAASTITWTADRGTQVAPGEYQEFSISAGPLPEPAELAIPAVQTYSDGEVVQWNEPTPASGEEPEHPAPTLQVVAATTDEASAAPSAAASAPTESAPAAADRSDTTARWLAGIALLVGAAGATLGALGLRRGARR